MADVTTGAASAAAAGVGGVVMAVLGIEPQALVWGFVGASIGATFAAPSSRWRAVSLFVAVTCSSALLGTLAAAQWLGGTALARNGMALLLGIGFHPLMAAFIANMPSVLDGLLRKVGLKQ